MKLNLFLFCVIVLIASVAYVGANDDIGQSIYTKNCVSCHASGVMGAPKVGDKDAWSALIAEGLDKLTYNSINGKGKMPAKGGNMKLTDEEVRAAVAYMMEASK